jgi:hypothetical protein
MKGVHVDEAETEALFSQRKLTRGVENLSTVLSHHILLYLYPKQIPMSFCLIAQISSAASTFVRLGHTPLLQAPLTVCETTS